MPCAWESVVLSPVRVGPAFWNMPIIAERPAVDTGSSFSSDQLVQRPLIVFFDIHGFQSPDPFYCAPTYLHIGTRVYTSSEQLLCQVADQFLKPVYPSDIIWNNIFGELRLPSNRWPTAATGEKLVTSLRKKRN
jgi:hypothetical protein